MRRMLVGISMALALCLFAPDSARAQEVQVALDEAGRIEVIDTRLAQRLGLFVGECPGFQEARLFQAAPGEYVLEVTTLRDGRTARDRRPLSEVEVGELRQQVSERLAAHAPRAALNQEGRFILLGRMLPLGLFYYGPAVPTALGVEDGTSFAGLYLLSAGSSFFLPWLLTQHTDMTYGQGVMTYYGASRGIAHGHLLYNTIFGDGDRRYEVGEFPPYFEEDAGAERGRMAAGLLLGAGEAVGGYYWAGREGMTAGTANVIGWGGDAGLLTGLGTGYLLDLFSDTTSDRAGYVLGLVGAGAGMAAGKWLADRRSFTYGDADVMGFAGALGMFNALMVMDWVSDEPSDKGLVAGLMAGGLAGMVVGDRLVRDVEFSVGQSILIGAGSAAGALVGLGAALLVAGEAESPTPFLTASALGATAGFGATYLALAPLARGGERLSLQVGISPVGLLSLAADRTLLGADSPRPLLNVQYRF